MRIIRALAPVAVFALLCGPALAQTTITEQTALISMSGHGEVSAVPDTAIVTSGVTSQGKSAREALDDNTAAMTQLIAALKQAGIAERDIQTSGFSVNPNYVYSNQTDRDGYGIPPKIVGYTVSNQVTVRVRDLDKLGAVLDQAVTVGANTINGISFSVESPSALLEEARKAAFKDAKAKAQLYAGEAGIALGRIMAINESQNYGQPQPYAMDAMASKAMAAPVPVPVQAGELTFAIDVSVSWTLAQ